MPALMKGKNKLSKGKVGKLQPLSRRPDLPTLSQEDIHLTFGRQPNLFDKSLPSTAATSARAMPSSRVEAGQSNAAGGGPTSDVLIIDRADSLPSSEEERRVHESVEVSNDHRSEAATLGGASEGEEVLEPLSREETPLQKPVVQHVSEQASVHQVVASKESTAAGSTSQQAQGAPGHEDLQAQQGLRGQPPREGQEVQQSQYVQPGQQDQHMHQGGQYGQQGMQQVSVNLIPLQAQGQWGQAQLPLFHNPMFPQFVYTIAVCFVCRNRFFAPVGVQSTCPFCKTAVVVPAPPPPVQQQVPNNNWGGGR
mmetsp:Transcript_19354/g.49633  ORF Transcript_19354/g.49633 Transcript_19354/m.49633 type:complete len:309 (-) Transcript_19354:193-1119(-)